MSQSASPAEEGGHLHPHTFRDALAALAGGVAIVACQSADGPRGLLVSSLTGLSVEPPRLLFCVRKEAVTHDVLLRAATCSIAILGADDRLEAERFSRPDRSAQRFQDARWDLAADEPPLYRGGLVLLTGTIERTIDAETHSVFFVRAHHAARRAGEPLVYFDRRYREFTMDR
ncbi:4-hydroxyphenylacetate 3-monooxygenase reductase component [Alphaproteobacteria bacterium SO-S41]|nr:4-hydroxyphenylacetate 3-monooxygenase reductase component [Alphaproteobacteria bacterium SO-S41]